MRTPDPDGFNGEFFQTFKEIPSHSNFSKEQKQQKHFQTYFMRLS